MRCPTCQAEARRFGKDRYGNQRHQCVACRKTFSDLPPRPLGTMRLPLDKAAAVLQLLLEGISVRAAMRVSGVNRGTVLGLLALMGERCERMLDGRLQGMTVVDIQCDEIWGFVAMKEETRARTRPEQSEIGDAYCFVGIERTSQLIVAWHLGRPSEEDAEEFAEKLVRATSGRLQMTTDGYGPYCAAIPSSLPDADFAQLVKQHATKDDHKYSPG